MVVTWIDLYCMRARSTPVLEWCVLTIRRSPQLSDVPLFCDFPALQHDRVNTGKLTYMYLLTCTTGGIYTYDTWICHTNFVIFTFYNMKFTLVLSVILRVWINDSRKISIILLTMLQRHSTKGYHSFVMTGASLETLVLERLVVNLYLKDLNFHKFNTNWNIPYLS